MDFTASLTFEFTSVDYENIILKESPFDDTGSQSVFSTQGFIKLTEEETCLFLHAVSLSDDLREKQNSQKPENQ